LLARLFVRAVYVLIFEVSREFSAFRPRSPVKFDFVDSARKRFTPSSVGLRFRFLVQTTGKVSRIGFWRFYVVFFVFSSFFHPSSKCRNVVALGKRTETWYFMRSVFCKFDYFRCYTPKTKTFSKIWRRKTWNFHVCDHVFVCRRSAPIYTLNT